MAHIFKYPSKSSKGIIIFTHKELNLFKVKFKLDRNILYNPIYFIKKNISDLILKNKFKQLIVKIKENYFIGVHWGWHSQNIETPWWVDFHMTSPNTVTFKGNPFQIPLSSAHFTPSVMKKRADINKYWDIICVAKSHKNKNYSKLLQSIRKIYDFKKNYKILFVIASNKDEEKNYFYENIFDYYYNNFSSRERELFTVIKTHPDTGFQGFSYTFLSYLYNSSKVFTLFSEIEGSSKVIKEALLCGLLIVVKKNLKGGGTDYLSKKNTFFFDKYENAHLSLVDAVSHYDDYKFEDDMLKKNICEKNSIAELKKYFKKIYQNKKMNFDGNLINVDNLNRRLPAHYYDVSTVPWASETKFRYQTTDISNKKMFLKFYRELKIKE